MNLAVLGVWVLTRTVGIAIGGDGTPEEWGTTDGVCAALEGLAVLASIGLLVPGFARRPLSAGVGVAGATFVGILVAAVVTLVFSPAVVESAGGTSADGHNHGGGTKTATLAAASGTAAATDGHADEHGPVALNGQKITGVKAADIAAEAQPDQPLDAVTRATLKNELTAARDLALQYPTVADATRGGLLPRGRVRARERCALHRAGGGLTAAAGPFDPTTVNSLIYVGTSPASEITGLMYYSMGDEPAAGFAGPNDHWHRHSNVCLGGGANKLEVPFPADANVTKKQCEAAGGGLMELTGWMVHAGWCPRGRAHKASSHTTTRTFAAATGPTRRTRPASAPASDRARAAQAWTYSSNDDSSSWVPMAMIT